MEEKKIEKVLHKLAFVNTVILSLSLAFPGNAFAPEHTQRNKSGTRLESKIQEAKTSLITRKVENHNKTNKDPIYPLIDNAYGRFNPPSYITKEYIRALVYTESTDNPMAVSKKGARGLGQLTIEAWIDTGEREDNHNKAFNHEKNIEVSIKYLLLIEDYLSSNVPNWKFISKKGKLKLISASYNGRFPRLKLCNWRIRKMPPETIEYVKKIEKNLLKFNG